MEYLENIAEDVSWHIIEHYSEIGDMTQAQLRAFLIKFLVNS